MADSVMGMMPILLASYFILVNARDVVTLKKYSSAIIPNASLPGNLVIFGPSPSRDSDAPTANSKRTDAGLMFTLDGSNPHQRDLMWDFGFDDVSFNGVHLPGEAKIIASHLRKVSNEELGVTAMQGILDSLPYSTFTPNWDEYLNEMADRLQAKVKKYLGILKRNRELVEEMYSLHLEFPVSSLTPCCLLNSDKLRYDEHFATDVSKTMLCDIAPVFIPNNTFSPSINLTNGFGQNLDDHPTIKWQYFISKLGIHSEYPAASSNPYGLCKQSDELRHRDVYVATVQPRGKHIVIIIDHGKALSTHQLSVAKAVGKYILSSLSHHDKVGLISLANDVQYPHSHSCVTHEMAYATFETKFHFSRFIDGLEKTQDATNHLLGFSKAFEMIQNTLPNLENSTKQGADTEALILYISRGLMTSIGDAKPLMEKILQEVHNTGNRVVINTYALIDEGKPIMYEKEFLQDIANQNYSKFNIQSPYPSQIHRGQMVEVNSAETLSSVVGNFYSVLSKPKQLPVYFSLPHWDPMSKDLEISISQAVVFNGDLIGVVGIDIALADLADEVVYFSYASDSYAFLMDKTGVALMHPSFSRPFISSEQPMHTDIKHLENRPGFLKIQRAILRNDKGEESLTINLSSELAAPKRDGQKKARLIYRWRKIPGTPYIIVAAQIDYGSERQVLNRIVQPTEPKFAFHRLDLVPTQKLCRHIKQLSTKDTSTLFLSPRSFVSPYEYLNQKDSKKIIQSYMAYLNDNTKLIANPGLKAGVRNDVLSVMRITSKWIEQVKISEFTKYIVRRYVATPSGVFHVYPGSVMDKSYDPTRRHWFTRAMEYPGQVVLTAPYLDVGGAGYIVTLSHTIFEGKPAAMHSTSDSVVAIMGMDFTLGYFHRLLMVVMPVCNQDKITCFILDDKGYLIVHPDLIEPTGRGPVEQQHITHKEPLVASDILNHKGFVTKRVCNGFNDRTVQRFYHFNTSLEGVVTNLVHGEHCVKYQITAIPGTNVFLGIVNQTCEVIRAFCPCSMTDRLCLNCHRMEQTECECPCECPLGVNLCTSQLTDDVNRNPSCLPFPEELRVPILNSEVQFESLEECFEMRCHSLRTESECFGVLGCEWCQLDSDGVTPLKTQFCTDQRKCFGGVLGARTPYADEIIERLPSKDFLTLKSTPVGPVAGGIMAVFVLLAVAVYCYRNHVQRGNSGHYMSTAPDSNIRMAHLDNEIDEQEPYDSGICHGNLVGHSNVVLANFEGSPNVSPYRVNTGYRRPPGGESDHGYSTMTPHEDSEHMPYIEPLLVGKDRHKIPTSQQSVSSWSRASSPVPHVNPHSVTPPLYFPSSSGSPPSNYSQDPSQTVLPEVPQHGLHVLAQVQVHMVDTH